MLTLRRLTAIMAAATVLVLAYLLILFVFVGVAGAQADTPTGGGDGLAFAGVVTLGAVVLTLTNLAKLVLNGLRGRGWNGAVTLLLAIGVAFGALWLYASTVWGEHLVFFGEELGSLSALELAAAALVVGGVGSVIYDVLNAVDASSSARKPELLGPPKVADPPSSHAG